MEMQLHYGNDCLRLDIPKKNLAGFIQPHHQIHKNNNNHEILRQAFKANGREFSSSCRSKTVGILLPDATRDLPLRDLLSILFSLLKESRKLLLFICTGTHAAQTEGNQEIIELIKATFHKAGIDAFEIIVHDCEQAALSSAGTTKRCTEIFYNARLDEPDIYIALSDVKHHYFAGYSNPIKNFVPGLCGFKTTEQNHSWTMDGRSAAGKHPWHSNQDLRDNPLAADQLEAMEMIVKDRRVWATVTISSEGVIQWADFGPVREVAAEAFEQADVWNVHTVERVDCMVVSCGGMPNDVDLYIAQRALELTHSAVKDQGRILFLAACPEGIGSRRTDEHFEKIMYKPLETILQQSQDDYKLYSHKPYRFAQLMKRLENLSLYSKIEPGRVEKMHMSPCQDPQSLIDQWIARTTDAKILVIEGAGKLLLRPKN